MSKIGVIYCCYGNPEYIDDCLKPWIEAKKNRNILIAAVHGQFKEYHDLGIPDNDLESIRQLSILHREGNNIEHLYIQNHYTGFNHYQTEAEIRDKGLQWLLKQNCDYIWLLDNDEFYTVEQINNIINYINLPDSQLYAWFSINFKNYIFSGREWVDGFCPPRIFKVDYGNYLLERFYWDNDLFYRKKNTIVKDAPGYYNGSIEGTPIPSYDKHWAIAGKKISKHIAHIKHLTWLHSNGKDKVNYQLKHFGDCSYQWNAGNNKLEFNLEYFKKNNLTPPVVYNDN